MWNLVNVFCDKCELIISDKDKLLLHKIACLLTVKLVWVDCGVLEFNLTESGQLN